MNDNELLELCKGVYDATGWDNKSNTPSGERLKVWQQGYSISEMGEGNDDYETTPPEERNKVNVYDWEVREDPRHGLTTGQEVFKWWFSQVKTIENNVFPLYTSDYLLEKLPSFIYSYQYEQKAWLWVRKNTDNFNAWYFVNDPSYGEDVTSEHGTTGDTPLKALLKLTIEISKKGLLDAKDN